MKGAKMNRQILSMPAIAVLLACVWLAPSARAEEPSGEATTSSAQASHKARAKKRTTAAAKATAKTTAKATAKPTAKRPAAKPAAKPAPKPAAKRPSAASHASKPAAEAGKPAGTEAGHTATSSASHQVAPRESRIEFDERMVRGQSAAGAIYLFQRSPSDFKSIVEVPGSFRPRTVAVLTPSKDTP
jgi:cytoskeletal protein RodZ